MANERGLGKCGSNRIQFVRFPDAPRGAILVLFALRECDNLAMPGLPRPRFLKTAKSSAPA